MLRLLISLLLFFLCFSLNAQERGVVPTKKKTTATNTAFTRALVVGISDYQDERISDLKYAHRDAEAFADYLREQYPKEQLDLQLLVNEQATYGNVATTLHQFIQHAKADEEIIIYFAGHGDVENQMSGEIGYLLLHDTNSALYSTFALNIRSLQDAISKLIHENKAKVLLITDACRAGQLAGSSIGGNSITNQAIYTSFQNATKILSCQPNEVSLEGERWGSGRGAFSYHFIEGLKGLADADFNGEITLLEIERYVQDKLRADNLPQPQTPVVDGERNRILVRVAKSMAFSEPIANNTPATYDYTEENQQIKAFYDYLERGELIGANGNNAVKQYKQLKTALEDSPLLKDMGYSLSAKLQEQAQKYIDEYLSEDVDNTLTSKECRIITSLIDESIALLTKDYFAYDILAAKKYFFAAATKRKEAEELDQPMLYKKALELYEKSLEFEPNAAYTHNEIGYLYYEVFEKPNKSKYHFEQAIQISPTWSYPYIYLSYLYQWSNKLDEAVFSLELASKHNPQSIIANIELGNLYYGQGQLDKATRYFEKSIEIEAKEPLSYFYLASIELERVNLSKAAKLGEQCLEYSENFIEAYILLAKIHIESELPHQAKALLDEAIKIDPTEAEIYLNYHDVYRMLEEKGKARLMYKKYQEYSRNRK